MRVTCHIASYASGAYQLCEHYVSMKAARADFRRMVNLFLDGIGGDGRPDATMAVYPYSPDDSDIECYGDYPMRLYAVGRKSYGEYTIRNEAI